MYEEVTRGIKVIVQTIFLEDQSDPEDGRYVWAYQVRIENHGEQTVQLLTRHWIITDALGRTQEVRGEGVVGEQPILDSGESYEYTSGTPLPTPSGIMMGTYQMKNTAGEFFDIVIPAFSLDSPHSNMRVN